MKNVSPGKNKNRYVKEGYNDTVCTAIYLCMYSEENTPLQEDFKNRELTIQTLKDLSKQYVYLKNSYLYVCMY